jgi:hypothetical protein
MLITVTVRTDCLIPVRPDVTCLAQVYIHPCWGIEMRRSLTDSTSRNSEYVIGYSLIHHMLHKGLLVEI